MAWRFYGGSAYNRLSENYNIPGFSGWSLTYED